MTITAEIETMFSELEVIPSVRDMLHGGLHLTYSPVFRSPEYSQRKRKEREARMALMRAIRAY